MTVPLFSLIPGRKNRCQLICDIIRDKCGKIVYNNNCEIIKQTKEINETKRKQE